MKSSNKSSELGGIGSLSMSSDNVTSPGIGSSHWSSATELPIGSHIKQELNPSGQYGARDMWPDCSQLDNSDSTSTGDLGHIPSQHTLLSRPSGGNNGSEQSINSTPYNMKLPLLPSLISHDSGTTRSAFMSPTTPSVGPIIPPYSTQGTSLSRSSTVGSPRGSREGENRLATLTPVSLPSSPSSSGTNIHSHEDIETSHSQRGTGHTQDSSCPSLLTTRDTSHPNLLSTTRGSTSSSGSTTSTSLDLNQRATLGSSDAMRCNPLGELSRMDVSRHSLSTEHDRKVLVPAGKLKLVRLY